MLKEADNRTYTSVGPGTAMGELLRRYWHPVAATAELGPNEVMPIRLLSDDLALFRMADGTCGLVDRHCAHRRADLTNGFVDESGLRCSYHGWCFGADGRCTSQPFEDVSCVPAQFRASSSITAHKAVDHAGLIWVYLGPDPAPLLPNWEPFSYDNGFVQVVFSDVPCNWLQCQENSIDPVHFEWQHSNWLRVQRGESGYAPTHKQIEFFDFDYGFGYRRLLVGEDESSRNWKVPRLCLLPNGFLPGGGAGDDRRLQCHFEWRVPVDDENTKSVIWHYTRVPAEAEPYRQTRIPHWVAPTFGPDGKLITSHIINQDFAAWIGQGRIADRSREKLGRSDRGIVMLRRALRAGMEAVAAGSDPGGVVRGAEPSGLSDIIRLPGYSPPVMRSRSREEWLADLISGASRSLEADPFWLAYGQPPEVLEDLAGAVRDPGR